MVMYGRVSWTAVFAASLGCRATGSSADSHRPVRSGADGICSVRRVPSVALVVRALTCYGGPAEAMTTGEAMRMTTGDHGVIERQTRSRRTWLPPFRRREPAERGGQPAFHDAAARTSQGGAVQRLERLPDPGEPIKGWSQTGPVVVDVPTAGGAIGVSGHGVVREAAAALASERGHTLVMTTRCAVELYKSGLPPDGVNVVATLDEAIATVHAELCERIRARADVGAVRDFQRMWLFVHADTQQHRLRSLLNEAAGYAIYAILLGPWPFGLSLTTDEDGRVMSASPPIEELAGAQLVCRPLEAMRADAPYGTQ
jgi:hypothetical protein